MDKEKNIEISNENNANGAAASLETTRQPGGLYAKVKMSVKAANILVAAGIALLVIVTVILVKNNGFTVTFDTDGGSHIDNVRVLHSEMIKADNPVKEGYVFTGWYTDKALTQKWDVDSDKVTESMTLYAGWEKQSSSKFNK